MGASISQLALDKQLSLTQQGHPALLGQGERAGSGRRGQEMARLGLQVLLSRILVRFPGPGSVVA